MLHSKLIIELRPMIFIAGNSRSGTTLMGRILGKHQDVFTFNELHFLEEIWMPVNNYAIMSKEEAVSNFAKLLSIQRDGYLKKRETGKYINEALKVIETRGEKKITFSFLYKQFLVYETTVNRKKIPCEKTPRNVLYLEELLEMYPDCKIICMIRDPKDVLLSQKKKWKRRFLGARNSIPLQESIRARINYHPFLISKLWSKNTIEIEKYKNNSRVMLIKFEDLLQSPVSIVRSTCSFLGIEFSPGMLNVEQKGSSVAYDKSNDAKIDRSKTGNWKEGLSNTEVFICEKVTRKERIVSGYADTGITPSYFIYLYYILVFPFQLGLAFLLNITRTRNIIKSIKKRLA